MDHQVLSFENHSGNAHVVAIEPWWEEYEVPPGHVLVVRFQGTLAGGPRVCATGRRPEYVIYSPDGVATFSASVEPVTH